MKEWYTLSIIEIKEKLMVKKAMNEQERNERQLKYGRNVLENGIKVPEWKLRRTIPMKLSALPVSL